MLVEGLVIRPIYPVQNVKASVDSEEEDVVPCEVLNLVVECTCVYVSVCMCM